MPSHLPADFTQRAKTHLSAINTRWAYNVSLIVRWHPGIYGERLSYRRIRALS